MAGFFQNLIENSVSTVLNDQITTNINVQPPAMGYGSYLSSILPPDVATAAGAFASAMGQIKNIRNSPIEKFAQVVTNLETTAGLPLINGTSVPSNLGLRTQVRPRLALGSGPQGTYTTSDFFGCTSGLPYNGSPANPAAGKLNDDGWYNVFNKLQQVATRKLFNIYHENYLAITWEKAVGYITQTITYVNVQSYIEPNPSTGYPGQPRIDDWYYTVDFGLSNSGKGYGRGLAPPPLVTLSPNNCGGAMTLNVEYDDTNTPGTFGSTSIVTKNTGTIYQYDTTSVMQENAPSPPTPPVESIEIEAPPTDMIPVQANGDFGSGSNNTDGYIAYTTGAPSPGVDAWPEPMNTVVQGYINQANTEIDSIYSSNNAACKSLNNSWNQTGAQLTIEQRARQSALRPPLDSDVREDYLSIYPTSLETWVDSLGTYGKNVEPHMTAQTIEAISDWSDTGGQSIVGVMRENRNQDRLTLLGVPLDNNISSVLTPEQQSVLIANGSLPTSTVNTNIPAGSDIAQPGTNPSTDTVSADIFASTNGEYTGSTSTASNETIVDDATIATEPDGYVDDLTGFYIVVTDGTPQQLDTGAAIYPGSFAGSPYTNLIPPNLNNWYASNTLLPNTYKVRDAIDEVIRCNCDCWQM